MYIETSTEGNQYGVDIGLRLLASRLTGSDLMITEMSVGK